MKQVPELMRDLQDFLGRVITAGDRDGDDLTRRLTVASPAKKHF